MERVIGAQNWSLIPYINSHPNVAKKDEVVQIPYIFNTSRTFRLFNNVLAFNNDSTSPDQFDVTLLRNNLSDPFDILSSGKVFSEAIEIFMGNLTNPHGGLKTEGWNNLMEYDSLSVRAYLLAKGFTMDEIDWLETMNDATGHYDSKVALKRRFLHDTYAPHIGACPGASHLSNTIRLTYNSVQSTASCPRRMDLSEHQYGPLDLYPRGHGYAHKRNDLGPQKETHDAQQGD